MSLTKEEKRSNFFIVLSVVITFLLVGYFFSCFGYVKVENKVIVVDKFIEIRNGWTTYLFKFNDSYTESVGRTAYEKVDIGGFYNRTEVKTVFKLTFIQ